MTLHDRIRAVVEERLRLAREAARDTFAANDAADAILSAEHALWILDQHRPVETYGWAEGHTACVLEFGAGEGWIATYPCDDIRALATRWRAEVDG